MLSKPMLTVEPKVKKVKSKPSIEVGFTPVMLDIEIVFVDQAPAVVVNPVKSLMLLKESTSLIVLIEAAP